MYEAGEEGNAQLKTGRRRRCELVGSPESQSAPALQIGGAAVESAAATSKIWPFASSVSPPSPCAARTEMTTSTETREERKKKLL